MFCGKHRDAEGTLLQAGLTFRAIVLNLDLYNWNRLVDGLVRIVLRLYQGCVYDRTRLCESRVNVGYRLCRGRLKVGLRLCNGR